MLHEIQDGTGKHSKHPEAQDAGIVLPRFGVGQLTVGGLVLS